MELFDFDPQTGIRTLWDYDPDTGKGIMRREQDATPFLDLAAELRNSGVNSGRLDDEYLEHYAILPPGVIMELKQKGIDIYDPNSTAALLVAIQRDYPHLKVTNRTHLANR